MNNKRQKVTWVWKGLGGMALSGFFLWLAFRKADLKEIICIIRQSNGALLIVAFFMDSLNFMLKTYCWKLLGKEYRDLSWVYFLRAASVAHMSNVFLPFRAGDLLQGIILSKETSVSKTYTLSTVFLLRLLDLLVVLAIIFVGSFFVALPESVQDIKTISLIIILVIGGVLTVIAVQKDIAKNGPKFRKPFCQEVNKIYCRLGEAIKFLRNKQVVLIVLPLMFFKWIAVSAFAVWLVFKATNIHLGYGGAVLIMAITSLSAAVPIAPGGLGTWEYFCLVSLGIFGVDHNRALSFALVIHVITLLTPVLFGSFFLLQSLEGALSSGEEASARDKKR